MTTQNNKWMWCLVTLLVFGLCTPLSLAAKEKNPTPVLIEPDTDWGPALASQVGAGEIGIFADQTGTSCTLSDTGPVPITYYVVHFNTDGANQVQYSAKKPTCFAGSFVNDTKYFTNTFGSSQTTVTVQYGSCRSGTILVQAINYIGNGSTSCCKYPVLPYSATAGIRVRNCSNQYLPGQGWTSVINPTAGCDACGPTPPPDTTCVYTEDFKDGEEGWVSKDINARFDEPYWDRAPYDDGSGPVNVMWCGADLSGWATGPGYGNNWNEMLRKPFTLGAAPVTIEYRVQYETEPGSDFLYLEISSDEGATYTELAMYSGYSGGFIDDSIDLSAYQNLAVQIRFRFASDNSWSDEDGLFDSDGAARLDWVHVTGYSVDDFESYENDWVAETAALPPITTLYRLEDTPACESEMPCPDYCNTWVAYEPTTGDFPFYHDPPRDVEIAIESPAIEIPTDAEGIILGFDVYANLPMANLVFYKWQIAAPPPEDGGQWRDNKTVSYATSGWRNTLVNVSAYVPAGTSRIKIRLVGVDMFKYWGPGGANYGTGENHNSAPMFDNVTVYAINTADPGIDDSHFPPPCGAPVIADTDLDGVMDDVDACPTVSSAPFDSDGDGCIDDGAGGRHVEYWARPAFPLTYVINDLGAPLVTDGSDFTAIQNGMAAWSGIAGSVASSMYGGTTQQRAASALDRVNLITFEDNEYQFGLGVLAVGLTTSFTDTTTFNGVKYRPGQIVDSDMIFNGDKAYKTLTEGPPEGTLIETVATHEAGHLFGIAHTAVRTSTMFYVLSPDTAAMTLATEDKLALFKAYGTPAAMSAASRLTGTVKDGRTNAPVPGAAVFAIEAATGDTTGCEFTLPSSGSYTFVGLPDGDYYLAIHPLNGSSSIGYLVPEYINDLVRDHAVREFVAESWDLAESKNDDPLARDPVTVLAGAPAAVANFVTNVDETGPTVLSSAPSPGAAGVSIGGSVLVGFSEPVNSATLQGNFTLEDVPTGTFVAGNAALLRDDSVLAFIPSDGLLFETEYRLTIDTGLQDKYGNGLTAPFTMTFTTEVQPDVAITSLSPSKGIVGSIVSVNGFGFDEVPANNVVTFNGTPAPVTEGTATQLVVSVPEGATSGYVTVFNTIQGKTSNYLTFTVLEAADVPRGFDAGAALVAATPRALAASPDAAYAYVGTDAGVSVVIVDPSHPNYLGTTSLPLAGGLDDVDVAPGGGCLYGTSRLTGKLYRIAADPQAMTVLSERAIGAVPRGLIIDPTGRRAYLSTDEGEIQIWDLAESSPTFENQVGVIRPPDANVRGKMAIDPAGDRLLAISGSGRLYAFELATGALAASVPVGPDPRDVVIDPMGERAYVCDETGIVSIVTLADFRKVYDVKTGGTLRAISITPAGAFAHVVNRELNLLNLIDLRPDFSTFRSVAATIPLPVNPIDIELSPDGNHAFTVSEAAGGLNVTTVGLGPSISTLSRTAAPAGGLIVIAGSDFSPASTTVSFNGVAAAPSRISEGSITVSVPAAATSGPLTVTGVTPTGINAVSNAIYFRVLGPTVQNSLRLAVAAASVPPSSGADGGAVLCGSPTGDFLALADLDGGFHLFDTNSKSATLHQYFGTAALGATAGDIAVAQNGRRAFAVVPGAAAVRVIDVNRLSTGYLTTLGTVDFSGISGSSLSKAAVSPDGFVLAVSDPGAKAVHFVDIADGSPTAYQIAGSVVFDDRGEIRQMAYHPTGRYLYLPVRDPDAAEILVVDTDPASPAYRTRVAAYALPGAPPQEIPVSLAFTPDGARCLVLTAQQTGAPNRTVRLLNTSNPVQPVLVASLALGGSVVSSTDELDVSPRGDRAIASILGSGFLHIEVRRNPDALALVGQTGSIIGEDANGYAPDASSFYSVSESGDQLVAYDFKTVQNLTVVSGNHQSGVAGAVLPVPLRVQVTDASGNPIEGVPIAFSVTSGGGTLSATASPSQNVVTDATGVAAVKWLLGSEIGAGAHTVEASGEGLAGSPALFTAEGLADPNTLPLSVTGVNPADAAVDVGVATAAQVTFSRAVNPASITTSTFFLHEGDMVPVEAVIGFADENRKVSLSPRVTLKPSTTYTIVAATGILDAAGGALTAALSSSFVTEPAPPVVLRAMKPVSGPVDAGVGLAGTGFSPNHAENKVLFGAIEAYVRQGGTNNLYTTVPAGAVSGPVRVVNTEAADTSNALFFTVLSPTAARVDDVVADVSTSSATRSVAITPDGAIAYAVSPYANVVIPIDLRTLRPLPPIPVGENPVAITIDPAGAFAYIANYLEGTVSVIDVARSSPTCNRVVESLPVGVGPRDVAIMPDGDRLIVVNYGSSDLSVVDTEATSKTHHQVIADVKTSSASSSVSITPDGGLIYLGTDNGYIVLGASSYTVVTGVQTGSATRTVSITPDGAILVVLTTQGRVNLYDIQPASHTYNKVVASAQTGSATKTVGISPDGGMLYLIQEVGDIIILASIRATSPFGVLESGTEMPPTGVEVALVDTLTAGEDPSHIAFDPSGSGRFIVTNAGDNTVTVFGTPAYLAGTVTSDSPQPLTPLAGVTIDVFSKGTGDLVQTATTGNDGAYTGVLPWGEYIVTIVTPLGYVTALEEIPVTLASGETAVVDFALHRETIVPNPKKMSYWKHEVALAISGKGKPEVGAAALCGYLDLIEAHFNSNRMNPVVVYQPPASEECLDKLQVAKVLFNLQGDDDAIAHAKQELMTLLFNVASKRLALGTKVSRDNATASQAITFIDRAIDDGSPANDETAWKTAQTINHGKLVNSGIIPLDVPDIAYTQIPKRFDLEQNYPNPFNPTTTIAYEVAKAVHVRLDVYDVAGRHIRSLVDDDRVPSRYEAVWDGRDKRGNLVATGVYFYRLEAGSFVKTRKMLMLK